MKSLIRRTHVRAAGIVFAILVATLALPVTSEAIKICDECAYGNDTTFTPGKSATGCDLVERALFPPIAFMGKTDSLLRCALPAAGGWQIQIVHPIAKVGGISVALDAAREPMIAYHDANGQVLYSHRVGNVWMTEPIDAISVVTGSTSIARVPAGAAIAYVDATTGLLRCAEQLIGGGWSIQMAAQVGAAEAYPSLRVDGSLRAISYYDAVQGDLRLAQSVNASPWTSELVDGLGNVGGYSSLVGGMAPGFGIAYYDFTNADLRYARSVPGGWMLETVDGVGDSVGRFCSAVALAGNPDDQVGVAYYDQTHRSLKYALKQGIWNTMVLDATGDAGGSASCGGTPVPSDTAGVAYIDQADGDLEYVRVVNGIAAVPLHAGGGAALRVQWLRGADGGGRVRFSVPAAGRVRVALYDAQGRLMAVPLSRALPEGPAEARWDGRDGHGTRVSAGVFFVRVETMRASGTALAVVLN